ncbi:hypothetical protein CNR22_18840 [Sphingobacteriaceae bacterium]|nr:hypothetical protein CNR22_18840 [Sphingobacteriaceae bacterium]
MNRETQKNNVSLFLHCQKLIAKPKRINYNELRSSLSSLVNESEYHAILKSIFNLADHYFLLEKYQHPTKLIIEINRLADKVRLNMNPHQKLIFITLVLKLIKYNKQENNTHLDRALFCIAEIFSYNQNQTRRIKELFFSDEPKEEDYHDSLLLTHEPPDYIKVIDGFRVIYNPAFRFKIWVRNIKSVNNMLFKIISLCDHDCNYGIKEGDVLPYAGAVMNLLGEYNLTLNDLSSKIIVNISSLPRIEIPATERSPKVILNSLQNRIEMEGISMTNHPLNFYKPVFYWLEKLKDTAPDSFSVHFNLNFFNTYASKIILQLMQKSLELETKGCSVKFYWHFEEDDEEMKETGEHYASIINRSFNFISTSPADLISA